MSALRAVPGVPNEVATAVLASALVLREWGRGKLTIGHVRSTGWQMQRRGFVPDGDMRWDSAVDYAGDDHEGGFITEAAMRDVIDRELQPFEPDILRLPAWIGS